MTLLTPSPAGVSPQALLDVAYADTRAADLSHALDLPVQPALRSLSLELGGLNLDLRILGYSHQVVIGTGAAEPLLTETVARLGDGGRRAPAGLPAFHEERRAAGRDVILRYLLRTSVAPLGADAAAIAGLMREVDSDAHAVLGVFPGHPHAFTGLRAGPAIPEGVEWRSWHAYPGSDELVRTHSRLVRDRA